MLALIDLFMLGARDPIRFGTRSRIEATLTDQHCCITLSPTTASVAGTDALERGRQHLESIVLDPGANAAAAQLAQKPGARAPAEPCAL